VHAVLVPKNKALRLQKNNGELVSFTAMTDNIDKVEEACLPKSLHNLLFSIFTLPGLVTIHMYMSLLLWVHIQS
jgi:hypothetical protein